MPKWDYLIEADERRRRLFRQAAAGDKEAAHLLSVMDIRDIGTEHPLIKVFLRVAELIRQRIKKTEWSDAIEYRIDGKYKGYTIFMTVSQDKRSREKDWLKGYLSMRDETRKGNLKQAYIFAEMMGTTDTKPANILKVSRGYSRGHTYGYTLAHWPMREQRARFIRDPKKLLDAMANYLKENPTAPMVPEEESLEESEDREMELLRRVRAHQDKEAMKQLKTLRIRKGDHRNYIGVIAHVTEGVWRNRWVWITLDSPRFRDSGISPDIAGEVRADHGYPHDQYETPWLVGVGSGFSTLRYLVYADNSYDALEECEEHWPDMFENEYDEDGDIIEGPEIRVIARCDEWQLYRKKSFDELSKEAKAMRALGIPGRTFPRGDVELLDGRVVEKV